MTPRTLGRLVGACVLLAFVVYLAGGALVDSALGGAATPSDVADGEARLAAGALLMLVNSGLVAAIGVLAFSALRQHHEITAHAYLVTRVFEAVILAVGVLGLLFLIPLAQARLDAGAGGGIAYPVLVGVARAGDAYALQLGMIVLGLGSVLFCRALFLTRLVPRPLAVLGLVGYPVLAAGEGLSVLGYDHAMVHYAPGGLFEVVFGVLLLVKGFPVQPDPREPTKAPAPQRLAHEQSPTRRA